MRFLRTKDGLERIVMQLVAREALDLQREEDLRRAQVQANEIAKLFKS